MGRLLGRSGSFADALRAWSQIPHLHLLFPVKDVPFPGALEQHTATVVVF